MEVKDVDEITDIKDKSDFIKTFMKLEAQRRNPSREGMIDALEEALKVAFIDIKNVEASRGETTPTPWEHIQNKELYDKLSEYQQGMYQHAVNKFGEEVVKEMLEHSTQ